MDVASQVGLADPLLPESLVRGRSLARVAARHLPQSARLSVARVGAAVCRLRAAAVPHLLSTRGWYTSVSGLRDPRYPEHGEATEALREAIVREINANADVRAMNLAHQARYRRWAFGFAPFVFNQEIYKDTAIYYSDRRRPASRGGRRVPAAAAGRRRAGGADGSDERNGRR